jgi:hypothetical protein
MKEKVKKVRCSIYIPKHLALIAESADKNKSSFIAKAIEYYVNRGGLKNYIQEKTENEH